MSIKSYDEIKVFAGSTKSNKVVSSINVCVLKVSDAGSMLVQLIDTGRRWVSEIYLDSCFGDVTKQLCDVATNDRGVA